VLWKLSDAIDNFSAINPSVIDNLSLAKIDAVSIREERKEEREKEDKEHETEREKERQGERKRVFLH